MPSDPVFSLKGLRKTLGLAQADMASRMGLSLRPYQQLELNPGNVRKRHVRLAETVAQDVAIEQKDPELAPASVRKKAMELVRLILRDNARELADNQADR